jgi:hypothetical protein
MELFNGEPLNDEWIHHFENTDKLYQDFYKDDVYYVNIQYIYINANNEIVKIRNEPFLLAEPNCITRDEIIGILKRNGTDKNGVSKYSVLSILKYNITLDIEDILPFLRRPHSDWNRDFLTPVKHIDTIHFHKTINMFQDVNELFIVYYEKPKTSTGSNHSCTKRVYFKSVKRNKTVRK